MVKYVRAELFKVMHRRYLYISTGLLCACCALLVAGFAFTNAHGNEISFYEGGVSGMTMMVVGLYATILVGDMVFSDQYKFNTLKNEVSYGLPRLRIYLGKLAVEVIVGVVMSVLMVVVYELLCFVCLIPNPPELTEACLKTVGFSILASLPQWLGAMAMVNLCMFLVRSNTLGSFTALGVIVVPNSVLSVLVMTSLLSEDGRILCQEIINWLPTSFVNNSWKMTNDWGFMGRSWLVGILWLVVCTVIGLIAFQKKEIN